MLPIIEGPMPVYQNIHFTHKQTHRLRSVDKRETEMYAQTPNKENRKPAIEEVGSFH